MRLLMIASISHNKNIIGYRLFDADSKDKKYMDIPVNNVKEVLESGKATIENLSIQEGNLVGANGSIERYPRLNKDGILLNEVSPLIIINQIGEVGYTVVDYKGAVKKARLADVVKYAKEYGISNGKVVMRDNIEFISSISGTYPVEKVAPSKVNNSSNDVKIHISMNNKQHGDNSKLAKNTEIDIDVEIEDNDVFEAMTDEQKVVLKAYYTWYTVDKYKSLAKNIRLDIAPGKAEKLAALRGITDWEFGGVWDTGYMGGSCCELGHTLRYEYYAVPSDERDNPDARIVFGETCASDFFHIKPEDMKSLVKTRQIMSDEIKLMADIIVNEQEKLYMYKVDLLYAIIRKLGTKENIVDVFGSKVGYTLLSFMMVGLPFPMSLAIECTNVVSKNIPLFFKKVFIEYIEGINCLFRNDNDTNFVSGGKEYLKFIATNKLEGDYAYNPFDESVKRRDIGRYNKEARYKRDRLIKYIRYRVFCDDYNFGELDAFLYVITNLVKIKNRLITNLNGLELLKSGKSEKLIELAEEFLLINKNREENKFELVSVVNSLVTDSKYCLSYSFRPVKVDREFGGVRKCSNIQQLKEDLELVASSKIQSIIDEFNTFCLNKEAALKDEIIQKELDEQNRLKEDLAKVEKDKLLKEEKAKKAKLEKEEEEANDRVKQLAKMLEGRIDLDDDYGVTVSKSIIESGKMYSELTPKQQWRINNTIKLLSNEVKEQDSNKEDREINNFYVLSERPDIVEKIERLQNMADSVEMQEVLKVEPKVLLIALTITKYNRVSDKQLKHINKAIDILDRA